MQSILHLETVPETQPDFRPAPCYAEAAPADEVMMEQLEYLLKHARNGRHIGCSECVRLDRIGSILLAPFM